MKGLATGSLNYFPALDGLRALAVLAVFAEHFTYNEFVRGWGPGTIGVRTFFVLSGFLITSILLKEIGTAPVSKLATRFYGRRLLRLAPAFYVAIALAALLGIAEMRSAWWIHGLYLSNFQILLQERWTGAGHFWTLAVEEQFYLLWFPLVVLAPRRWLLPLVLTCLALAPAFRSLIPMGASPFINVMLPGQVDSLAAGALVALARFRSDLRWLDQIFLSRAWLIVLWTMTLAVSAPLYHKPAFLSWVLLPSLMSLAAACLVRTCVEGQATALRLLCRPAMIWMGKRSYGLYIFHYLVPPFLFSYIPAIELLGDGPLKFVRLVIWVVLTLVLAELSWRYVERPFLRLKDRFRPEQSGTAGRSMSHDGLPHKL
ncbi:acyltransferase [Loktanella sp. SALINAS62]|uniref:acyltransferase family protein n=1 Tax=Loktanella sp. SALINAS62 TaxID=2706124 RepID=UPI001B8D941C|nr:acyltransferase [Loktanella sp. SALINAS62]MBS1302742.1 acyltransferase [Loktanella sp. SALINAS62]